MPYAQKDLKNVSRIAQTIRERRSIKTGYTNEPVSKELITELLEDAVWAPTHGLREPWRFIFVSSEEKEAFVEQLVQTFPIEVREAKRNNFSKPAAILIVIMKTDPRQKQWEENFGAVSSLIQNFSLLAWERQLGVVWKTNPHIYDPKVRALLDVQADEKIAGFLHMGYFDEVPKARPRTAVEELLTVYSPK
ncbi:nitroreductase family protein [Bacillus fonticola]|uniref:nitroreductase family protein n=1 Tax=Bacillus fonticola TaxID=2728853 RepID=UPI0014743857|nr:nitroreductase [Bacillus fonticola]